MDSGLIVILAILGVAFFLGCLRNSDSDAGLIFNIIFRAGKKIFYIASPFILLLVLDLIFPGLGSGLLELIVSLISQLFSGIFEIL